MQPSTIVDENNFGEDELTAKIQSERFPQHLNLCNFEREEAIYSPYVLTSPRSLKACRLANVKPIELLRRSIEEISVDFNLEKCQISNIYDDYEQDRLKKLEICKLIRKHILTSEHFEKLEITHPVSPFRYDPRENTPKPSRLSRDNTPDLPHIRGTSRAISSYSMPSTPETQRQKNKFLSLGLSNSNSVLSSSSDSVDCNYPHRSKSVENQKYKHKTNTKQTFKKFVYSPKKTKKEKKNSNKSSYIIKEPMNDRQLCWEIDKTKKAENDFMNKKIQPNHVGKKKLKVTKKNPTNNLTHEENSILKNSPNLGHSTAKTGKKKLESEPKTSAKKRNHECQNDSKQSLIKQNAKNRKTDFDHVPLNKKTDISPNNEHFTAVRNHDARILDAMISKKEKQETRENLASKANIIWANFGETSDKIKQCHQSRSRNAKSNHCACNESFALDSYFQQIKDRIKQLKENCLYKELHGEQVRQLARELQIGMEQWQDQVLLLQWRALQRAQTNARLLLENKRLRTQSENKERTLMHALRFRNAQQLEQVKQQIMKKEIEEKNGKIEKLKMKREQEISSCRAQAHYTAELREQLRNTLTPETFDRKVTDVITKSRFVNRLITTNPFESKIRLG